MMETVRRFLNEILYDVEERSAHAHAAGDRRAVAAIANTERRLTAALREIQEAERAIEARRELLNMTRAEAIGVAVQDVLAETDGGLVWIHAESCQRPTTESNCACEPRLAYVLPPDEQMARATA